MVLRLVRIHPAEHVFVNVRQFLHRRGDALVRIPRRVRGGRQLARQLGFHPTEVRTSLRLRVGKRQPPAGTVQTRRRVVRRPARGGVHRGAGGRRRSEPPRRRSRLRPPSSPRRLGPAAESAFSRAARARRRRRACIRSASRRAPPDAADGGNAITVGATSPRLRHSDAQSGHTVAATPRPRPRRRTREARGSRRT